MNNEILMRYCLDIAKKGIGNVNPNPMVGCVIIKNNKIVGEGFHKKYGGPHAEIIALKAAGKKVKDAIMFVNLEPCSHFGKTPPCVDAIIDAGISKVVVAVKDPNPLVQGRGIELLKRAGVDVQIGILKREAELLNEKFFKYMKTGLPYVSVKIAQTLDGRIADIKGRSRWITSEAARKEVHRLRSEHDAVLVGANTARMDDPELTVRFVNGRNPLRIVIDGRLLLPAALKIFNTNNTPTWIITSAMAIKADPKKVEKLAVKGVRVLGISSLSVDINLKSILKLIAHEGITSVLIEGGARTASSFINQGLSNKLYLFIAPKILGGGLDAFKFEMPKLLNNSVKLKNSRVQIIGEDILVESTV